MKKIKKNKLIFRLIIITITMIILGLLYIAIIKADDKELIKSSLTNFFKSIKTINHSKILFNSLITNIILITIVFLLTMSIIGIPVILVFLSYKSFVLGFTISSIIYYYRFKGIIISIIYIIPLIINLFTIFILSYYGISISKKLIRVLFYKKEIPIKKDIKRYIRLFIMILIITIINSLFEAYIIPILLSLLQI